MSLSLDTTKQATDRLKEKFLELVAMDRDDERFLALFDEVHQAIDAEMSLDDE